MTATSGANPNNAPTPPDNDVVTDVVIIGAGISGIGAAYRITERNPGIRYVILERRDQIGGTWDLFRYPGVRSDSSIFTLSFPWEPWTGRERIADGGDIHDYLVDTAAKYGIAANIRFHTHVVSADWDSATDTWTVRAKDAVTGAARTYRGRFVFFGSGYYNYDEGYAPGFRGQESFAGTMVHPQFWPEDLDFSGKRVVVIGSGATAISLVPALAETASKVTMLQRSPTYLFPGDRVSPFLDAIRKWLPRKLSAPIVRFLSALLEAVVWLVARTAPGRARAILRRLNADRLPPGYPVDIHFRPRYAPWDQRLCLVADGDLFTAISEGSAEVVTDTIDHFDETGIVVSSGNHLDADIVVTATGLQLQALGGIHISMDGVPIKPQDRFVYKAHMLEDVPNLVWCVGYTNASWTLRADITARATAKLIAYMTSRGYTHAYPHLTAPMPEKPTWDIQAGYVLRNLHALPKSGTKRPWNVRQNYFADALDYNFVDKIDEDIVFGRNAVPAKLAG
jgi:cation diffusion facilitator CzcD-associated flavoprotein CzcO